MNLKEINQLVKEAVPRCSPSDQSTDFYRYIVWLENPDRTIKGRNKAELKQNLINHFKLFEDYQKKWDAI